MEESSPEPSPNASPQHSQIISYQEENLHQQEPDGVNEVPDHQLNGSPLGLQSSPISDDQADQILDLMHTKINKEK